MAPLQGPNFFLALDNIMSSIERKTNMRASVASSLPQNRNRNYLLVVADDAGPLSVSISGGPAFDIPAGAAWEPDIAPINDIVFTGVGTVVEG
jgi:hypothetical protein